MRIPPAPGRQTYRSGMRRLHGMLQGFRREGGRPGWRGQNRYSLSSKGFNICSDVYFLAVRSGRTILHRVPARILYRPRPARTPAEPQSEHRVKDRRFRQQNTLPGRYDRHRDSPGHAGDTGPEFSAQNFRAVFRQYPAPRISPKRTRTRGQTRGGHGRFPAGAGTGPGQDRNLPQQPPACWPVNRRQNHVVREIYRPSQQGTFSTRPGRHGQGSTAGIP